MTVKPEPGPITRGKGLDALDRFIIQNWAPPARFAIWSGKGGALAAPRAPLERFFNEALKDCWARDGSGGVITIDPPADPFVVILVEHENRHWTPEAHYNPKHWVWKVVPLERARPDLDAALALPGAEGDYLRGLKEGRLASAWG